MKISKFAVLLFAMGLIIGANAKVAPKIVPAPVADLCDSDDDDNNSAFTAQVPVSQQPMEPAGEDMGTGSDDDDVPVPISSNDDDDAKALLGNN